MKIINLCEGTDVTDIIGVTKYEQPIPDEIKAIVRGGFPPFIPKTKELRIQSNPNLLEIMRNKPIYVTEKLDGVSVTYYRHNNEFGACMRRYDLKKDEKNIFWKVAIENDIEEKLGEAFCEYKANLAIQCELIGIGLPHKNKYQLKTTKPYVFNVFDIDNHRYLNYGEFTRVCEVIEMETVPIIYRSGDLIDNETTVDDYIELSYGYSKINTNVLREGIVVRTKEEFPNEMGFDRLSFKVINPKYLLKHKE